MKAWRRLRRRVLTPDASQTAVDVRGFHVKNEESREVLETVGGSFLGGFAIAAEAARPADAEKPLETTPDRYRGFAYEGAAMAFAIRDALPGRSDYVRQFLAGRGDEHIYMAYVGVGWALARLPQLLWKRLHAPDPLLRWLVLDGYGFHQAYFKTTRYVHQCYREPSFPWPADSSTTYAVRAIDQGIGRASWFVAGTDPRRLADLFSAFPRHRYPDLWAGAGLAAAYAGGASAEELRWLRNASGPYHADLAQGAAFAAGARTRAGLVVPHNELAARELCDMSVEAAAKVTDDARIDLPPDADVPAYEVWRQRTKHHFRLARESKAEKA